MVRPFGVILAGGASSRMGRDKALVEVAGSSMIEWVAQALGAVCSGLVVAGRPDGVGPLPGIGDPVSERRGPLSGLASSLEYAEQGDVLVVAVDQPWVRPTTLQGLAEMASVLPVIPLDRDGVRQTTCARYPTSMLSVALDELYSGGSIQSAIDRTAFTPVTPETWEPWGEDGRSWFSVDTDEALAAGLERFGPPAG